MAFFTPKHGYTHRGAFYKIPIYIKGLNSEAPTIVGTNIVFDWFVSWWPQVVMTLANSLAGWMFWLGWLDPDEYEPQWVFKVYGKLR